jgi:hypothetical protein
VAVCSCCRRGGPLDQEDVLLGCAQESEAVVDHGVPVEVGGAGAIDARKTSGEAVQRQTGQPF